MTNLKGYDWKNIQRFSALNQRFSVETRIRQTGFFHGDSEILNAGDET